MTLHIRIIVIAAGLISISLIFLHVNSLRAQNARLTTDNATLISTNAANKETIQILRRQADKNLVIITQWAAEKTAIRKKQEYLTKRIEELQGDEDFKRWSDIVLPDSIVGLLSSPAGD